MGYEIVRYYFTRARVEEHVLAMTNQISKKNRNDCNTQDPSFYPHRFSFMNMSSQ